MTVLLEPTTIANTDSLAAQTLQEIETRIAARHVLTHPFYQAWNAGTLTPAALQDYATQYYHHVAAFPAYLSAVHSHTDNLTARRTLLQNLMDEEAGSPNHPELWLDFAQGIGVSKNDVMAAPLQPETQALISDFRQVCREGHWTQGVAALYAYESQIPEVAATKIAGLQTHYGVTDAPTLRYFDVHQEADEVHRAEERGLLNAHIATPAQAESAVNAAQVALDGVWNLLSGVCHRHHIAC